MNPKTKSTCRRYAAFPGVAFPAGCRRTTGDRADRDADRTAGELPGPAVPDF